MFYKGHPVAAVAATSPHFAEEALALIDVEYEPLPAVTNVEDAMRAGAPILHEHWEDRPTPGGEAPRDATSPVTNCTGLATWDQGFAEADVVLERDFRTKTVHQGYIEPQNATAWWAPNDRLTVWCSSQGTSASGTAPRGCSAYPFLTSRSFRWR